MEVDLCDKSIFELCFNKETSSDDELAVALSVTSLRAERNRIRRITGLGAVFTNLVELRLAHNYLGEFTAPPYLTVEIAHHRRRTHTGGSTPRLCDGVASWLMALPRTLQILDLSYNHLNSFAACSCLATGERAPGGSPPPADRNAVCDEDGVDNDVRFLRHLCPLAVSLFFSPAAFPQLRELNLSHNALTASLAESDAMEGAWREAGAPGERCTMIETLDLSYNPGLSSVNCVLLSSESAASARQPSRLRRLVLGESGLDDLRGLSAVTFFAPSVQELVLHPSPLSTALLHAPQHVLAGLLETLIAPLSSSATEASGPSQQAVGVAVKDLATSHMDEVESAIQALFVSEKTLPVVAEGTSALAMCVYACLLHEVVPSLQRVDEETSVELCHDVILQAVQAVLLAHARPPPVRAPCADQFRKEDAQPIHGTRAGWSELLVATTHADQPSVSFNRQSSLSNIAAEVAPRLRSRVVMVEKRGDRGEVVSSPPQHRYLDALEALQPFVAEKREVAHGGSSGVDGGSGLDVPAEKDNGMAEASPDWFTPTTLTAEEKEQYEALCAEAQQLEDALLASQERRENLRVNVGKLQDQLTEDRRLVGDQRRSLAQLRGERDALQARIAAQTQRIKKRKKDVVYGATAIHARELAAQEQAAKQRIEAQEKDLARRERALLRRIAQAGPLTVQYQHSKTVPPPGQQRKLRSEVLREAAIRKRIIEQERKEPLSYTPSRFKEAAVMTTTTTTTTTTASHSPSPDEQRVPQADELRMLEEEYFATYGPTASYDDVVEGDNVVHAVASAHIAREAYHGGVAQRLPSMRSFLEQQRAASSMPPPPSPPPTTGREETGVADLALDGVDRDLSALSLAELFEAAAAIRRKQLAFQRLHAEWSAPPSASPSPPQQQQQEERGSAAAVAASAADSLAEVSPATPSPPVALSSAVLPPLSREEVKQAAAATAATEAVPSDGAEGGQLAPRTTGGQWRHLIREATGTVASTAELPATELLTEDAEAIYRAMVAQRDGGEGHAPADTWEKADHPTYAFTASIGASTPSPIRAVREDGASEERPPPPPFSQPTEADFPKGTTNEDALAAMVAKAALRAPFAPPSPPPSARSGAPLSRMLFPDNGNATEEEDTCE